MNWGNQTTFNLLKDAVVNGGSYDEVFKIVADDVMPILTYKGLSEDDAKDVLQEICISVLIRAVPYLKKSENFSKEQRNAWLRRIIKCKVSDFFRTYYRYQKMRGQQGEDGEETAGTPESGLNTGDVQNATDNDVPKTSADSAKEDDAERRRQRRADTETGNRTVSIDTENGTADIPDPTDYFASLEEVPEKAIALLKGLFSIRTTPDKLIAFVYNKIICSDYKGIITYKTSYVSSRLDGKPVGMLAKTVKPQLEQTLKITLPDEAVAPLMEKLSQPDKNHGGIPYETAPFEMTPRQITDSSNWIMNKFKEVVENVNETFGD